MKSCLSFILLPLLASALPARGWELGPADGVVWTPPAGQAAESNALAGTAAFLADTLTRLASRPVAAVRAETAGAGIHLILVPPAAPPTAQEVFSGRLEAYVIAPSGNVLRISGPTAVAVRNGVMAFLHRQGCRWLLPSPKWWIIPLGVRVAFDGREEGAPAFAYRRIWYAYGASSPELTRNYEVWSDANRLGGVAVFQTGHSYGSIIDRNPAEFAAHPDYFAVRPAAAGEPRAEDPLARALDPEPAAEAVPIISTNSPRNPAKFCSSNPGLRDLCLRDRTAQLRAQRAANPYAFMVSMDPSDGPGTCDCPACRKLGTPTDRVVSLANHVARGLRESLPDAWVGMYAYSSHREPPTIPVESNIHVQVAMAFNHSAYTYEELIRLWGEKAGSLGIREYYGVEAWDFGLPGRIRGASPAYHATWIPRYRAAGAVSVSAESNDNWGPQALGFYVAARLLWDTRADAESVTADFLNAAFGPAAKPMGELYASFATAPRLTPDIQARMFDLAFQALDRAAEPAAKARIVDVIAYLNYVQLFARFEACAPHTEPYYAALEAVMNYAYRIQSRGMVAAYALARRLCNANVKGKRDEFWLFGESVIWKHGEPYTDAEILEKAAAARASFQQAVSERRAFSGNLVAKSGLPKGRYAASRTVPFRHAATAYLLPRESGAFPFQFGPAVTAYLETAAEGKRVAEFKAAEPGAAPPAAVPLTTGTLYRLVLKTGGATSSVTIPDALTAAFEASPDQPLWLDSGATFYLYVPAGTTELRCSGNPRLSLLDPGQVRTDINRESQAGQAFASIPVKPSQAGRLWTVGNQTRGEIAFYNVPALVQLDDQCVLLPRELVEAGPGPNTEPGQN